MSYRLNNVEGRIKYFVRGKNGTTGSTTRTDSAEWMLRENKPYRSDEFEGYPIAVDCNRNTYFFSGTWIEPDETEVEPKVEVGQEEVSDADADPFQKPRRKRRVKDVVCE